MRRDPRLQGLSSDHHRGLLLARRVANALRGTGLAASIRASFEAELEPHFRAEEEVLLPALAAAGEEALAARTWREHAEMREHLAAAEAGDVSRLSAFAALLEQHIRFEERELFPTAEARLPDEALARIASRCPHPTRPSAGREER